mgnify:CR=1 FL=1
MHIGKYCTDGNRGLSDQSWSGESSVGIDVAEAYWAVEIAIPAAQLFAVQIYKAATWGLDVAVVRSSHSSAFAQQG